MRTKRIISCFLLLSVIFCICSCSNNYEYEYEGITYDRVRPLTDNNGYTVVGLSDEGKNMEVVYIYAEIEGLLVKNVGSASIAGVTKGYFTGNNLKKIYFPWSIEYVADYYLWDGYDTVYIISASTKYLIDYRNINDIHIIPNFSYQNGIKFHRSTYDKHSVIDKENVIPANIAYFFNYEGNPNEGYFFIDLLEESGTLTKPRYDPKREGYTFEGWYKEAECINAWNFDTDTVIINYDEEGNRIYEEFCLYAKWAE